MNEQSLPAEYFVICRGQWDPAASRDEIKTAIDPTSQPSLTKLDRNVGENPHISGNSPFKRRDPAGDQSKLESTPYENFTERCATLGRIGKVCASYLWRAYAVIP
jgi:hypothetical protein